MEIKPYTLVRRPPCPFYGFSTMSGGVMKDSGGNQCALKTKSYNPCQREIMGHMLNWLGCPLNTKKNRRKIERNLEKMWVFPREFRPEGIESWEGILLKDWVDYINNL